MKPSTASAVRAPSTTSSTDETRYTRPQFDIVTSDKPDDKRRTDDNEGNLQEIEKLTELKEKYSQQMDAEEYESTLAAIEETPTPTGITKRFLITNRDKLIRKDARWGEDEDSFTSRLAKLQNW